MTGEFTLDTAGFVEGPAAGVRTKRFWWCDLDAFTQGYVEALFVSSLRPWHNTAFAELEHYRGRYLVFSDLAPETLAAILKDCRREAPYFANTSEQGARFWRERQARGHLASGFPPLTATLGDDGKVYLRDAQPMSAFAERVLANVREEIRDEVAYALELAGEPELLEALKAITEEVCDYALINNLGDPEQQHNVKLARAAIAKTVGQP